MNLNLIFCFSSSQVDHNPTTKENELGPRGNWNIRVSRDSTSYGEDHVVQKWTATENFK